MKELIQIFSKNYTVILIFALIGVVLGVTSIITAPDIYSTSYSFKNINPASIEFDPSVLNNNLHNIKDSDTVKKLQKKYGFDAKSFQNVFNITAKVTTSLVIFDVLSTSELNDNVAHFFSSYLNKQENAVRYIDRMKSLNDKEIANLRSSQQRLSGLAHTINAFTTPDNVKYLNFNPSAIYDALNYVNSDLSAKLYLKDHLMAFTLNSQPFSSKISTTSKLLGKAVFIVFILTGLGFLYGAFRSRNEVFINNK